MKADQERRKIKKKAIKKKQLEKKKMAAIERASKGKITKPLGESIAPHGEDEALLGGESDIDGNDPEDPEVNDDTLLEDGDMEVENTEEEGNPSN